MSVGRAERIALVGLPGAGKTTVGRLLADELGWAFFDCDAGFEADAGMDIAGWVGDHGWAAFREHEVALLASALRRDKIVIATGGGVVEDEKNRAGLAASTAVVWLDAPPEVLAARLGAAANRPLLADAPPERLKELAERRNPFFTELADLRIDAADADPAEIATAIVRGLASRD